MVALPILISKPIRAWLFAPSSFLNGQTALDPGAASGPGRGVDLPTNGAGMNPYGYFDDPAREYVITRPDTPWPWLNYLGQEDLFGLCTNTAGGYTFWRDARLRRLTRCRYNNVPIDTGGRCLYVRHDGVVWNPGWKPVKAALDRYECRHGLGYTRITGARNGIEVEVLFFVPPGETVEVWKVTVRNRTGRAADVQLFSFVEFCLFEANNDAT